MNPQSERLGNESIGKLLKSLSIPAASAMMVNGLYNVVDAIFIGRGVGENALGGLAIAFPIQMLIMSIAHLVGIGAASAVSRNLGANNVERADKVAGNAFSALFIMSILFMIFGLLFVDQLLYLFGSTETIFPFAKEYIVVILMGSVFFSFAMMTNNLVRAEGNAKIAMITIMLGAITNILLDPLFIFVFNLGIKGAAMATIISQFISFSFVMYYMYSGKSSLKIKFHHLKLELGIIKEILSVGFSSFARMSMNSVFAIVVNNSLRFFGGDAAIIIFGVVNRILAFLLLPIIGVVQGMQPIAGFNYGAKKIDRVKKVLKLSLISATAICTVGWIVGETIPHIIIGAFTDDAEIIKEAAFVFRVIMALVPLLGVQFVGATLFQAIGRARPALFLSLLRQIILLIPLILILPRIFGFGLFGVWLAFPIADILASSIVAVILIREMRKPFWQQQIDVA